MAKLTLNTIGSRYGSIDALNANFDAIEAAIENTLSRDGTSPNTMLSNMDMNSRRAINMADGVNNTDAVTLRQVNSIIQGAADGLVVTVKERATATAGQTVFNLGAISYTPGSNNLSVYIDGVRQYSGESYTETSASVVTFSSGLNVGAEVLFVVNESITSTTADASNVTYTPAGAGAVATTVQAKLRESVSVKDFGAVGDGVTDDTAAILLAIAAQTSNFELVFPAGIYIVNSSNANGLKFDGKSNFAITGWGATIKVDNGESVVGGYEVMSFFNCSNGVINGLTIDGNRANRTIPGETSAHALTICDSCSQITLNDVIAVNSVADGFLVTTFDYTVAATYPTDITLNNCVADNSYRNGLSSIGSLRLTINGGEFKNTNGTLPKCGIDIEPDSGYTYGNRQTVIDGARLFNNDGYGAAVGGPTGLNQNVLISNVVGGNNDLGFLNIGSGDNVVVQNVVVYDHSTATRGVIDFGSLAVNPILDGANFINITANTSNHCIYLHGSITGVPTIRNVNVENSACPILYAAVRSDVDSIYGNFVPDVAIQLDANYSSLKNVQLSNCADRSIYVAGTNVTLDGIHLVDCGAASSRAIQFEAADAIVRNVDILFTGARPANFVGILFNSGVPRLVMNVLGKAASSDFNAASIMSFTSGVTGATIRNVSPSPFVTSQAWNPSSIADGASESVNVTVTGVVFGMVCYVSLGVSTQGMALTATVSASDTITATLVNNTGSPIDLASSTLTVWAELM